MSRLFPCDLTAWPQLYTRGARNGECPDDPALRDNSIPQLGLDVWQVRPEIAARVVSDGIAAGYRLIDTAEGYKNEEASDTANRPTAPNCPANRAKRVFSNVKTLQQMIEGMRRPADCLSEV